MKPYIDVRGTHPAYVKGLVRITLPNAPRDITVEEAELLITRLTPVRTRSETSIREERHHLIECTRFWQAYRTRNHTVDPELPLDRIGSINDIIRNLESRREAL